MSHLRVLLTPGFEFLAQAVAHVDVLRLAVLVHLLARVLPEIVEFVGTLPSLRSTSLKRLSRAISVLRKCPKTGPGPGLLLRQRPVRRQRHVAAPAQVAVRGRRARRPLAERRQNVVEADQLGPHVLGRDVAGPVPDHRRLHHFLVHVDRVGCEPLAPQPVPAQQEAVVAGEDDQRVVAHAALRGASASSARDLVVERRDGGGALAQVAHRCPSASPFRAARSWRGGSQPKVSKCRLGVHVVVLLRMAVVGDVRVEVAGDQEERLRPPSARR